MDYDSADGKFYTVYGACDGDMSAAWLREPVAWRPCLCVSYTICLCVHSEQAQDWTGVSE